ncbi:MAG: RNA polymerase sigma factor FliA [Woeseiaceae bacterium]|nr:RNA polymerase sigma factor FliA [Woeseiaceae bacterium]
MNAYSNVAATKNHSGDDLIIGNIGLVKRIAHHLAARLPSSVDIDDLMQSGMVGLLEAASNFDPDRGASFETYAGIRIRGAMLDDIRKHDWTPRSVHHKYRRVTEAIHEIESEYGRAAEPQEIADRLEISINEYHKILTDSASSRLFSLDETLDEPTLHRPPPASKTASPDDELFRSQFQDNLADAIQNLPERERLVLSLYYEQELNLKEIGNVLDVSESRVCQIHGQAVLRLRAAADKW